VWERGLSTAARFSRSTPCNGVGFLRCCVFTWRAPSKEMAQGKGRAAELKPHLRCTRSPPDPEQGRAAGIDPPPENLVSNCVALDGVRRACGRLWSSSVTRER
jgi:hypothetical protein